MATDPAVLPEAPVQDRYPLTPLQRGMLAQALRDPASGVVSHNRGVVSLPSYLHSSR